MCRRERQNVDFGTKMTQKWVVFERTVSLFSYQKSNLIYR